MKWLASKEKNKFGKAAFFFLLLLLVSLAFSFRFINSLSIIMLVLLVLTHPQRTALIKRAFQDYYFLALTALFLMQLAGLIYTTDQDVGWKEVTKKAGLIAIPFFFCAIHSMPSASMKVLMISFSSALAAVSIYCLLQAAFLYYQDHNPNVFFYHQLVLPFKHHAIYFSFFLFYCILYWLEDGIRIVHPGRRGWLILLLLFFLIMIILLSSKLVIVISFLYLIYFVWKHSLFNRSKWIAPAFLFFFLVLLFIIAMTNNPLRQRFADLTRGNSELYRQEKFSPGIYFNGLQFRLLTWRFTFEILEKKKAWLWGVSPGDAQHELNRRYKETNMYLGDGKKDKGFWNYNCHNVYLQTTLESGLVGFLFLLLSIIFFLVEVFKRRSLLALIFFTAILIFGFVESVLSTQFGILLFVFFPLLSLTVEKRGKFN